jgi:hypothetical protein
MVWIVNAELKDEYRIFVEFNDGVSGIIDFVSVNLAASTAWEETKINFWKH